MTRTQIAGGLLAACALHFLAACGTPFANPRFEARPKGQTAFPGVLKLVKDAPKHTLDIMLVHGMCTHTKRWAKDTIAKLSEALGGAPKPKVQRVNIADFKTELYRAVLPVRDGTVRATALVWSPVVAPLKRQLCYDQTEKSDACEGATPYPNERASINRELKDVLLDDCLADAIIYQGKSRDMVMDDLQSAILAAAAGPARADFARAAAAETTPLVFVTESLGSKMTFDAVNDLVRFGEGEKRAAGVRTLKRATQIFMAANQIPMLALADQTLDGRDSKERPANPLDALIELREDTSDLADTLPPRVIAFTDPNDLLSYTLVHAESKQKYDVVDVIVSNRPTLFGAFENPDPAHRGYLQNEEVLKLIACGHQQPGDC